MKDEYLRNHAIEPEFVERKDSIKTYKDRISTKRKRQLKKQFSFDSGPVARTVENDELSDMAFPKPLNSIEYSVYEFSSVNIPLKRVRVLKFLDFSKCTADLPLSCLTWFLSAFHTKHAGRAPSSLMNPRRGVLEIENETKTPAKSRKRGRDGDIENIIYILHLLSKNNQTLSHSNENKRDEEKTIFRVFS
jgi:hypothetical protein